MTTQFIRLVKNDKSLLRFKLKCTPNRYNSPEGEVDIIVDSANKKIPFEFACIQTDRGRLFTNDPTDSVSWHGFYSKENDEIKLPVINFKSGNKKTPHRHTGTVNQADIFLFPICSAYIPGNIDLKLFIDAVRNENTEIINISNNSNARVDFFVLPKSTTVWAFMSNYSHSLFYCIADISIFNKNLNGVFQNLPVKKMEDVEFRTYTIQSWDILVRIVYSAHLRETDICNAYSILFHDPNDAIQMLLNRKLAYPNGNGGVNWDFMGDRYRREKTELLKNNSIEPKYPKYVSHPKEITD